MALLRARPNEIPKDAVRLTEQEAVEYMWNNIEEYPDQQSMISLRYGPGILGSMGAATGMFVNSHYRNRLRLARFGFIGTYLPIAVLPAIMASLFNRTYIQPRILLKKDGCPLCLQLRAAALQCFLGTVYPTILAPLATYMFAVRHYTFRLPSIVEDPMALYKVYRKMTKPIVSALAVSLGLNALVASYLTYHQQLAFAKMQVAMNEQDRLERRSHGAAGEGDAHQEAFS